MEAGLRALGHRYCSGGCAVSLGGFAAVRAIRIRRQRRAAAFCSREWQEIASPPGSRSGVPVPLTSPALANVSAVAVGGDGNGAAGDTRKYRVHCKDMCCICSWPASCRGKPLGYKVDDTKLKRAGLDYWPYVVVKIHDSWDHFCDYFMKQDFSYRPGDWLVFGSETKGLPQQALEDCCKEGIGGGTVRIPMVETYVRCLNLSVSVGIALYEAARQLNYEQLHYQPELPQEAQGLFPAEDIYA